MRKFKTFHTLWISRLGSIVLLCSVLLIGSGCQCCGFTEWYADRVDRVADCPWNMEWAYCRSCDLTRIDCRDCPPHRHGIASCPQGVNPAFVRTTETKESEQPAILQVSGVEAEQLEPSDVDQVVRPATTEAIIPAS